MEFVNESVGGWKVGNIAWKEEVKGVATFTDTGYFL